MAVPRQVEFDLDPDAETLWSIDPGPLPIGYYLIGLRLRADDGERAAATALAVLPVPQPDPALRIGAGESYPGYTVQPEYAGWVERLALCGASCTLAFAPFTAYDAPPQPEVMASLRDVFEALDATGVGVVAVLGNLPADLVNQQTNKPWSRSSNS